MGSSVGGSLIVLLLLVAPIAIMIICISSRKWEVRNSSSSQTPVVNECFNNETLATESNVAYKSVQHAETVNDGYEMTQCRGSNKQSTRQNWDSKLDMEQNMAYESSSAAQISFSTNVAYYKAGSQLEENVCETDGLDEYYDYIN